VAVVLEALRVTTWEPDMLIVKEDGLAVMPAGVVIVTVTDPVNPPCAVTVMVVVLELPCITLTGLGEALIAKSDTLTVTVVE
jgi:hypothetical protein